jgi:hypothetical protein
MAVDDHRLRSRAARAARLTLCVLLTAAASGGFVPTRAAAATWKIQPAAVPPQPNGSLDAISCPNSRWCAAVGEFNDTDRVARPLLELLAGARWRLAPTNYAASGGFTSISCISPRYCIAVGTTSAYTGSQRGHRSVAIQWNGRRWSAVTSPPVTEVRGVSCVAATTCIAVGQGAARWDGRRWTPQPLPSSRGADLQAVACINASDCFAGGSYVGSSGNGIALTERWDGRSWSVQQAYTGVDDAGDASSVDGIACASPRRCVAVGSASSFNSSSETTRPFSELWNGRTWSVRPAPAAHSISCVADTCAAAGGASLVVLSQRGWHTFRGSDAPQFETGVSCASPRACVAVGSLPPPGPPQSGVLVTTPVAVRWNGSRWKSTGALAGRGTQPSELRGVACPSSASCLAVGVVYSNISQSPFAEAWDGHAWRLASPPAPPGGGVLDGVSCSQPRACVAVGYTLAGVQDGVGRGALIEAWNGSAWSTQATPPLSGQIELHSVSCTSPAACVAVGLQSPVPNGISEPLIERWDGVQWSVDQDSAPGLQSSALTSVSCASAVACAAVGSSSGNQIPTTFAEIWNGSTWIPQSTPNPAPTPLTNALASVSCTGSDSCVAVGSGGPGFGQNNLFAERWDGASWTVEGPAPGPVGAPNGLACGSTISCEVVGAGPRNHGASSQPQADRFNGAAWTAQNPPGPPAATLESVSCPSASECVAVGATTTEPGPTTYPLSAPLIERYS